MGEQGPAGSAGRARRETDAVRALVGLPKRGRGGREGPEGFTTYRRAVEASRFLARAAARKTGKDTGGGKDWRFVRSGA
jgi:hypothetical protein